MWPIVAIVLLGIAAGIWWHGRGRAAALARRLEAQQEELARLREQQLQARTREETEQQALFNSMVEGVLILDGAGRVRLVNQALERLFGLSGDIHGRTVMEAFRIEELHQIVNQVRIEGRVLGVEMELPGLEKRCLEVNAAVLAGRDAQAQGTVLVFHDLTRLKQLENTRTEFVANVSHELRTPLSMIKGYAETLINGAKDDPAVCTRFLQTIEKHADRLTYLIEDLLTISRLESGKVVLSLAAVELESLVGDVMADLEARSGDKEITIENLVKPGLAVNADAERLRQVLFNLLDNAIKYGRAGGRVWIDARSVKEDTVQVSVRDNGPGIPPDALERVFERFYRADKARSREQGGTGLGLAIMKHIVHSHGGEVWAESVMGQGATFYFTLPRA